MTPHLDACLTTLATLCKGDREATIALTLLASALGSMNEPITEVLEKFMADGREMYLLIEAIGSEKP